MKLQAVILSENPVPERQLSHLIFVLDILFPQINAGHHSSEKHLFAIDAD